MKQREIKYEAWDGHGTMFVQVLDEVTDYGYVFVARSDLGKPPSEQAWYPFGIIMADPKWIKRQWTGLVDKCGNEVYEGDVVEGDGLLPSVVIFHEGAFRTEEAAEPLADAMDRYGGLVVIGNIYENPEPVSE